MKKLILIISVSLLSYGLHAQIGVGPTFGLNMASVAGEDWVGDDLEGIEMRPGVHMGLTANLSIPLLFQIQPSVLFSMQGTNYERTYVNVDGLDVSESGYATLNYLKVPLHFIKGFGPDMAQFQIFLGPYLGYGIGGKYENEMSINNVTTTTDGDVKFEADVTDPESKTMYYNTMDYGLDFGIGVKITSLQVQAGYGLGLANINTKFDGKEPDGKATNRNIYLSLSYLLGM